MFENLTLIPHSDNELSQTMDAMNEIATKFRTLVSDSDYRWLWYGNYIISNLAFMLATLDGLTGAPERQTILAYYENDDYHFNQYIREPSYTGIVIHEAPSTRFNPSNYPSAEYLEGAQDFLKQTSHHFLKIFTIPDSNIMCVWTNKRIEANTLYGLVALEQSLHNKQESLLMKFVTACTQNNITIAKKTLIDFLSSDAIIEREYETFKQCIKNTSQKKIQKIERDIQNYRENIQSYENEIVTMASKMRELSENLCFLKYMENDDDDTKLFFKHLKRIPYIKDFSANKNGFIHLEYEAPLIYFSEMPAEKLLKQSNRGSLSKEIIKMIIGRKYELITKCALEFNTANFSISSDTIYNPSEVMKHPHISRYHCFGNHRQAIYDSAEAGDYIGAIEQITQAVLNVNFFDVCVIDTMCRTLEDNLTSLKTWRCKETGEMFSTHDVIARGDYYEKA